MILTVKNARWRRYLLLIPFTCLSLGQVVFSEQADFSDDVSSAAVVAADSAKPTALVAVSPALPKLTEPLIETVPVTVDGIQRIHVRVNNTPVVSLPPSQVDRAVAIANRLQGADLQPERIMLDQLNELPVATLDEDVVFTVDHLTAAWYNQPMSELAVSWVNNLRLALGGETLDSTEVSTFLAEFHPPFLVGPHTEVVWASWYGAYFEGRPTASGEIFQRHQLTAAHRTLPLGTRVRVTSPQTGESVVVRINDRGPYVGDRSLDLSEGAARQLGVIEQGVVQVEMQIESEQT